METASETPLRLHRYRPAAWLRVTGGDAPAFLQGQFTNELRPLQPGEAAYGLWLDQKGGTVADSFVVRGRGGNEFWIASYFCPGESIRGRLEKYIIADDVTVEDEAVGWAGVSLWGAQAEEWARDTDGLPGFYFPGRRGRERSWEWIHPAAEAPAVAARLAGAVERSDLDLERARIDAAIPAVPRDAGPGDLPSESGLDEPAISYTKGCYLGQEIMARIKSRGLVRRRLMRVAAAGAVPALPARLWQGERPAGELRSAAARDGGGYDGLAMLGQAGLRPEAPLSFRPGGEGVLRLSNSC